MGVLVSSVPVVVGAGMLTILVLQFPFSGSVSISNEPFVEGTLRCLVLELDCPG